MMNVVNVTNLKACLAGAVQFSLFADDLSTFLKVHVLDSKMTH